MASAVSWSRTSDGTPSGAPALADVAATVLRHVAVNADYRHLVVAAGAAAAAARPGQFFELECPAAEAGPAPFLRRPMSCYRADPDTGEVEFLYKLVGAGTRGLARLAPGDALPLLGPLGHGFMLPRSGSHIAVVGRGVGLATLAPLAEWAARAGVAVTAMLSARERRLVMSARRFTAVGAEVVAVTDADGTSDPEHVAALLRGLHAAGRLDAVYTCGSRRLTRTLGALAAELGIAGEVALEQHMACGLGMCHCCVRTFAVDGRRVGRRVCWDGPVFPLAEVM